MYEQVDKPKENMSKGVANSVVQRRSDGNDACTFVDNRLQRNEIKASSPYPIQRKITGLTDLTPHWKTVRRQLSQEPMIYEEQVKFAEFGDEIRILIQYADGRPDRIPYSSLAVLMYTILAERQPPGEGFVRALVDGYLSKRGGENGGTGEDGKVDADNPMSATKEFDTNEQTGESDEAINVTTETKATEAERNRIKLWNKALGSETNHDEYAKKILQRLALFNSTNELTAKQYSRLVKDLENLEKRKQYKEHANELGTEAIEGATEKGKTIEITGTKIANRELTMAESSKFEIFKSLDGDVLPTGTTLKAYLEGLLGDINFERIGDNFAIRLSQGNRIEFKVDDRPESMGIKIISAGTATYKH